MTTAAAARLYLAQHLVEWEGKGYAFHNPHDKPLDELPIIWAFSNVRGGGDGICYAMAQDGTVLGSHWCSNEAYAPHDLGVTKGARQDRHDESYTKHYPDGYRMSFVNADEVSAHPGLNEAFALNKQQAERADAVAQRAEGALSDAKALLQRWYDLYGGSTLEIRAKYPEDKYAQGEMSVLDKDTEKFLGIESQYWMGAV